MIAAIFGLVGIVACLFVADAWDKQSGVKVATFLAVALVCFGISIAGVGKNQFPNECDDYSRFATSC
jgi:hypothetical protein